MENETKNEMDKKPEPTPNPPQTNPSDEIICGISRKPPHYHRYMTLNDRSVILKKKPFFFHQMTHTWDGDIIGVCKINSPVELRLLFYVAHGLLRMATILWTQGFKLPRTLTCEQMKYVIDNGDICSFMFMQLINYRSLHDHFECNNCVRMIPSRGLDYYELVSDLMIKWHFSPKVSFHFTEPQFFLFLDEIFVRRDLIFLSAFMRNQQRFAASVYIQVFNLFFAHMNKTAGLEEREKLATAFMHEFVLVMNYKESFLRDDNDIFFANARVFYCKHLILWGCGKTITNIAAWIMDIFQSQKTELLRHAAMTDQTAQSVRALIALGVKPNMRLLHDIIKVNENAIPPIMEALFAQDSSASDTAQKGIQKLVTRCRRDAPRSLVHSVLRVRPRAITNMLSWNARCTARSTFQYVHEYIREAMPGWVFLQTMNVMLRNRKLVSSSPIMSKDIMRIIGYYVFKLSFLQSTSMAGVDDNDNDHPNNDHPNDWDIE